MALFSWLPFHLSAGLFNFSAESVQFAYSRISGAQLIESFLQLSEFYFVHEPSLGLIPVGGNTHLEDLRQWPWICGNREFMERVAGFEPATTGLEDQRSAN